MLHIRKLSVGSTNAKSLIDFQKQRLAVEGRLYHRTRNSPKRKAEILDGGSIYWIVGGKFCVRQRIIGFEFESAEEVVINDPTKSAKPHCLFMFDKVLHAVINRPHRPFQGWRYLENKDKPADISSASGDYQDIDSELLQELRDIGIVL